MKRCRGTVRNCKLWVFDIIFWGRITRFIAFPISFLCKLMDMWEKLQKIMGASTHSFRNPHTSGGLEIQGVSNKKVDQPKSWLWSLSNAYTLEVVISNKFSNVWTKIVNFLLKAYFRASLHFFAHLMSPFRWYFRRIETFRQIIQKNS